MDNKFIFKQHVGFTLIELMVVIAIIALLSAIVLPNFFYMRNKAFCSEAETDANHVAMAISDYYSNSLRSSIPTIGDLDIIISNPLEIKGDPNTTISILVTDRTGRCPENYQNATNSWANYVFTKYFR